MNRHIKRIHRGERVHCKHGCGRSYVKKCDSLHHHERTCDSNPDAAHIGGGINQQHHDSTRPADKRMRQVNSLHGDNFRMYRKSLNSNKYL